ncbi:MAG: DUF305 domain-containing protein [Eubacteriales bacterium]|nr:DUF305 domain-containing protein [Eubacteriales bacterium]
MKSGNRFSDVTINYLNCFENILDEMIRQMTAVEPTDSISHTFIVQMIPHHMAAIEMSRNLLKYTTCIPLQDIAQGIIAAQTQSIQDMQRVDGICQACCNSDKERRSYLASYEKITNTMFSQMRNAQPSNNINVSFMREMIPHHMGAVRMSRNALAYPICPELKPILQAIITSQEQGIRQMQRLLSRTRTDGC